MPPRRKAKVSPVVTQATSIESLAIRLDVSPWTIRTWLRKGMVPYFKIGRRVLVRVEDVDALLASAYQATTRNGRTGADA
jgi:excisionase family DNA binding protein